MRFVLVTGLSGAGKTQALHYLEDMGYFCVDNIPPSLIPKLAELCNQAGSSIKKAAVVVDIRGGLFFSEIYEVLPRLEDYAVKYESLFLESSTQVLVKRYKENRRAHPLESDKHSLLDAILAEREFLGRLKENADYVIDTSSMLPRELKKELYDLFSDDKSDTDLHIRIQSFGFKRGLPIEADIVFDARFLPNPFYIETLKQLTGKDKAVRDYVFSFQQTEVFLSQLHEMLRFLIPNYIQEGKTRLIIAIGCTGGMHRSVVIAEALYLTLIGDGYRVIVDHRDMELEKERYLKRE